MLASVQQQLRDAQTSMVRGQEREAALQQDLSQAQQQLAQAEAEAVQLQGAHRLALSRAQDELAGAQSALAEEQGRHRSTRSILAGVRQALEQASAAVVKLQWAQKRQDQSHAAAQAALQAEVMEAQQRQWQAEQDAVSLRQALSQAQATVSGLQGQVASAQDEASETQETLTAVRQTLSDIRSALSSEQGRYGVVAQVLSSTQQRLSEASARSAQLRLELDDVNRAAAVRQDMLASVQQQLRDAQTSMVQGQERQADLERTLTQARQDLARVRGALEQEQGRSAAQGNVLASTQAALSETSASLAEVRAMLAEQAETHASAQAAMQSDKQQWVERFWDMERKSNETRAALRHVEQAHAETRQALDQMMQQARVDGIRRSQLSRDVTEARQALERETSPTAAVKSLADLVRQRFADEIQQNQLSVREGRRGVKLSSADMFDFARTVELGRQSARTLDRLTEILQETPSYQVRFAVHTDNIPLKRGAKWPTNWELSTARAAKLARYLINKGVAGERLSISGYGDSRPVADNSTPEGRRQNRRVEVIIKPPRQR